MTTAPHDPYTCAAVAALSASGLSLAAHNVPAVPATVAASLLKALSVVSIRGKTHFHSQS